MKLTHLNRLKTAIAPWREQLLEHKLYRKIDQIESLRQFMEYHVFAVWDFMSLLKTLQQKMCCTNVPWIPPEDSQHCRLVNEIVLAEESDEDGRGGFASHFDLYLSSMKQCGASTSAIDLFITQLKHGTPVERALDTGDIPDPARQFVKQTFELIRGGDLRAIASAFTFGREDLLPDVFQRIVDELDQQAGGQLSEFKYYLVRHIGLDGDEHGPMAQRLVESLCGNDEGSWQIATDTAVACLKSRLRLWDGIESSLKRVATPL